MKKLILTCLMGILSSSNVYAQRCNSEFELKVSMRNFGSENCVLKKKYVIQGYVYQNDVPSILADSGELYSFTVRGKEQEIKLSYQCGEYKKFTLYMHQKLKHKHYHTSIDAKMTDVMDVFEKHTTKLVNTRMCYPAPGEVSWQISH